MQQFNQSIITIEENMVEIRDPQTFFFLGGGDFYWPKYVNENLKHEFEFIIKSNEYFAENKIKSDIELLLSKYKH